MHGARSRQPCLEWTKHLKSGPGAGRSALVDARGSDIFDLQLSLPINIAIFVGAAIGIAFAGVKASKYADRVADKTGLGEALTGTIFLGFLTALPGLVASVVVALQGRPAMAISNAIGGIAIQTVALAVADMTYRRANLEHAAASVPNMMQTTMLVLLITVVMLGFGSPDVAIGHVHPVTILLALAAGFAFYLVVRVRHHPMWRPEETDETVVDEPDPENKDRSLTRLIIVLLIAAIATAGCGAAAAIASDGLVEQTGLSETVVGAAMLALATSLPELVTSIAAVRRGALTLAVSDIVGGNFFDILFVAAADIAYFGGSIYHAEAIGSREIFLTALTLLLNVELLAGLICRQKDGPAGIGFESTLMLLTYVAGFYVFAGVM